MGSGKTKHKKTALTLMTLLVCIWGMDYIFAKNVLNMMGAMNLLFLKYLVGFFILVGVKLKREGRSLIRKKDIPLFILCSLSGEVLYFFCEYTAMSYIPVSLITIILAFVPGFSIIIEKIVYKRDFSAKMVIGILTSVVGIGIIIGADIKTLFQGRVIGYLLAFGAVISWNAYNFLTANLSQKYPEVRIASTQLLCTILLIMPYALHTMPALSEFTPGIIGSIIYLGVGSAGVGFVIFVYGLKKLGPTVSAMFSNFLPVTATIFSWIFLGEIIGLSQILGGAIVIGASCMVIIEKGRMEERSNDRKIEPDNAN